MSKSFTSFYVPGVRGFNYFPSSGTRVYLKGLVGAKWVNLKEIRRQVLVLLVPKNHGGNLGILESISTVRVCARGKGILV
jgi:hypothetical protein